MSRRVIAGIAAVLVSGAAFGQGTIPLPGADPIWGIVNLASDFLPDPHRIELSAGGPVDATQLGEGCTGWIPEAPSYAVLYSPAADATWPLMISAMSDRADLVLAVHEPLGTWHCNDDTEGTDPLVTIPDAGYGLYTIWVGTYEVSAEQPASLFISEVVTGWDGTVFAAEGPNLDLLDQEMRFRDMFGGVGERIELGTGFLPDPYTGTATAGGTREAPNGCAGYIGGEPDFIVVFTAGTAPLIITAYSETDTTLVVQGPDLEFACNDDAVGHDPLVRYDAPVTGVYAVWIGTYAQGPEVPGVRFEISERGTLR